MSIEAILQQHIAKAIEALYSTTVEAESIKLETTKQDFEGDFTFVVFPYLRISKKNPEQTATDIGNYLKDNCPEVGDYNVIKGFLNLVVANNYWATTFYSTIASNAHYGKGTIGNGHRVMVEYSSPNTNKPLHLGHIRNNLLGFSVSQILEFNGYEVVKANLINDRGIHICKSMLAWQKYGNGETPQSSGLKGDHLVGKYYVEFDKHYKAEIEQLVANGTAKDDAEKTAPLIIEAQEMLRQWEAGNEEVINLWKTMNGWVYDGFETTYKRLGVNFDKYYYESQTYLLGKEIVEEGLAKGIFYRQEDSSVWIDLTAENLDKKLLLRRDGTSVYMTQDLGTADKKFEEYGCDKSVYVVGNEQDYHFKVLFSILKKMGKSYADGLYHLSYGMVDLPSGKMKSREGTVVDADDLMDEMHNTARELTMELGKIDGFSATEQSELFETLGLGALKYFLLRVDPAKRLLFDPKESIDFAGNTGPFIQYTHARICSLLKNIEDSGFTTTSEHPTTILPHERDMIVWMAKFPKAVEDAGREYSPAVVANYVYELAKLYNRFYHESPVNKEQDTNLKSFRVLLTQVTGRILKQGLTLLGIKAPERM